MRLNVSEKVELTPQQHVAWEETLAAFSWRAAAFTHVLYDMLNPDKGRMAATFLGPNKVPHWYIAGTNGKRVFLVAERFFKLDILRRIFLLAHEVCHPMLGHIVAAAYYRQRGSIDIGFKSMKWSDELANFAQDFIINDMLIESRIGTFVESGVHDTKVGTYRDSWVDVYEKLYIEATEKGGSGSSILGPGGQPLKPGEGEGEGDKQPERNGQKRFDAHMEFGEGEPGKDDAKGEGDEEVDLRGPERVTEQDMQRELQRAAQATEAALILARARGNLPAAFQIFVEKALEPVVDWTEHLRAQFARKLGSGGYDFRRPDRRLIVRDIYAPGRSGFGADVVVVGGDSSGSIYAVPELVARWMGEVGGIMEEVRPVECHVVWCDAKVQRVDVLTDPTDVAAMVHKGAVGGGGTDFRPVFEYCDTLGRNIDCMAFLTDGDGTFPDAAPKFPVIWGDISGNPDKYPFGDVVKIPVPKKVGRAWR